MGQLFGGGFNNCPRPLLSFEDDDSNNNGIVNLLPTTVGFDMTGGFVDEDEDVDNAE